MLRLSASRLALVMAAATVVVGLAEFWLRPLAVFLFTPLLVSALALVLAYRVHVREVAAHGRHEREMQRSAELQLATVEALALAIDARERSSQSSLRREQRHAAALARAFGMSHEDVECVRTAALLHDVGKLAVPDHILSKPGPLTDDERSKMRTHASVGAAIVQNVPFPYPVASLIGSHHERWDGAGYPAGFRGTDIPLGARILAVVDYFAALTSDRPFGRARPADEVVSMLREEAGKAFDPAVVARYLQLLPALQDVEMRVPSPGTPQPGTQPAREGGAESGVTTPPAADLLDGIGGANRELSGLYAVAEAMGTSLGVADSMAVIASKLKDLVPFATCALFVHDSANGVSRCRFATGAGHLALPGLLVRDGAGLVGAAVAARECIMNGDPAVDLDMTRPGVAEAGLRSALVCPLMTGSVVRGALALYRTAPGSFTDDHRRLVGRMSAQVAAVLHNAILFEQTREESVTDPLTGLPNNRFLAAHAARELARAARLNSSVTVMLLDLDNLKPINDTFGHQAGNRALCAVAAALRGAIRPYDICVRYGGDEFIVFLSDFGAEQARAKRVELQHAVEHTPFGVDDLLRMRLTISIGTAVFPADGDSYDALLQVADRRMYADKAEHKQRKAARALPAAHETRGDSSVHRS